MIKLLEEEVYLQVRKEDINLVKQLAPECENEYTEILQKETKTTYKTKLHILEDTTLNSVDGGECGGVILYNKTRKITCLNSLQGRLDLCFEELLPQIRSQLFPTE